MEGKNSFLLYTDVYFMVKKLTDEQAGKLFKLILAYANDLELEINDPLLEIAFEPIKQSLIRDEIKYQSICNRNKTNGLKGGRPKNNPKNPVGNLETQKTQANPKNPSEPKKAHIDIDIDSDSDIDNENIEDKSSSAPKIIATIKRKNGYSLIDFEKIINAYHISCNRMSKITRLSDPRKKAIAARLKEYDMPTVLNVLEIAGKSDFLCGINDKSWSADFDWIFNQVNFLKILEGKYSKTKTQVVYKQVMP